MKYKNQCTITQLETDYKINEPFNEWLQRDEYYILDIDELAKDLGNQIIETFKEANICTWDNIAGFVEDTLDEIRGDLQYSVEEYLTNNWE